MVNHMIGLKKFAISASVAGAVLAVAASPVGAVTTATWNLSQQFSNQNGGPYNYTATWTTSSTADEVVIKGYQESTTGGTAHYEYRVVEKEWLGWGDHWSPANIYGNYPLNGTWYSHTFYGVPDGKKVAIRVEVKTSNYSKAGGNAYQS